MTWLQMLHTTVDFVDSLCSSETYGSLVVVQQSTYWSLVAHAQSQHKFIRRGRVVWLRDGYTTTRVFLPDLFHSCVHVHNFGLNFERTHLRDQSSKIIRLTNSYSYVHGAWYANCCAR